MEEHTKRFEDAVREYLAGNRDWDSVHELAVEMEWNNQLDFPPEIRRPMEELQMVFLPDSKDDPQFRASKQEISALLDEVDRLRQAASSLGVQVVSEGEKVLQEDRNEDMRSKYRRRHERRHRSSVTKREEI